MKPLKVMVVCGFGLGTSLVLKMTLDDVLAAYNFEAETFCADSDTAVGQDYDLVVTSQDLAYLFKHVPEALILIDNFLSTDEVEHRVIPVIKNLNNKTL